MEFHSVTVNRAVRISNAQRFDFGRWPRVRVIGCWMVGVRVLKVEVGNVEMLNVGTMECSVVE